MIGKVRRLFDERVGIGRLLATAISARMRQHTLDDAVCAAPMLGDLSEVAGEHFEDLINFATLVLPERGDCGRRCFLQLLQQFEREVSEVIDKIERVPDLAGRCRR